MESQRSREIKANQGVVVRGILQFLRIIIFIGAAFWLTVWLLNNEILTLSDLYRAGVPTSIPPLVIQLGIALVITLVFQTLYFIFYMWVNPAGRRRTGKARFDGSSDPFGDWSE